MTFLKISLTAQQRVRLTALKKRTGLSFAEILRRAFDAYHDMTELKGPISNT
jgi:hypothetical protein